jgi:DNA-directed RNA polymerase specialized sigma24 family protein
VPVDHGGALTFARLLAALHPDPEQAALAYEHLRRALIRFFEWRAAQPADECADVTLERLEQKLSEADRIGDVQAYAYGIARLVSLERLRRPVPFTLDTARHIPTDLREREAGSSELEGCFHRCLEQLAEEARTLLMQYYEHDGRARIEARRRLAAMLGISDNALRIRVQRLRDRLEACVSDCVRGGTRR